MKFTVSLSEFRKTLQKTLPAIPPKSTLPVLEHLHFELTDSTLKITASDQDITIISKLDVEGEEIGKILVPARRLNEIVNALGHEGTLKFSSNEINFEIHLSTSNGLYDMKGIDPNEYLDIPELFHIKKPVIPTSDAEENKAFIPKNDMIRLAGKTVFAVSNDEFRPAMTGVLFQFREDHVFSVATDSYRLVKATALSENASFPKELDVIIPARSVDLLKRVDEDVNMNAIEMNNKITHLRFEFGNTIFITRIVEEKFPPYETVIPQNNELKATVDQRELLAAIRRVAIFTSIVSKQIRMHINSGSLTLEGDDEETGAKGDEQIPCEFNSSDFHVGFNYKFLEEAVQNLDADSSDNYRIEMTFSEPNRPVLLKATNDNNLLMLIMPVRISKPTVSTL